MATVDPIGIALSANETDCSCDYTARSDKPWPRSRQVGTRGITRAFTSYTRSVATSTRYELEDWAHKHLSGDSIINRLSKRRNISNICPNCFLPLSFSSPLDLDLTDRTFFRGQTIPTPRFSIAYKTVDQEDVRITWN